MNIFTGSVQYEKKKKIIEKFNSMDYAGDLELWSDKYWSLPGKDKVAFETYMENVLPYIVKKDGKDHIYWSKDRKEPIAEFEQILNLPCANKHAVSVYKPKMLKNILDEYYQVCCLKGKDNNNYNILKELEIERNTSVYYEDDWKSELYHLIRDGSYEEIINFLSKIIPAEGARKQQGDFIIIDKTLIGYTGKDKCVTIPDKTEYIA